MCTYVCVYIHIYMCVHVCIRTHYCVLHSIYVYTLFVYVIQVIRLLYAAAIQVLLSMGGYQDIDMNQFHSIKT